MRIRGGWIKADGLQAVLARLQEAHFQALLVGGCVRNDLLDHLIADVDIATDALPQDVVRIMSEAGMKVVPTGIDHGTVTVVAAGVGYEVTTFRRDIATDGRRATVAFTDDVAEDAARRDFTMNALYADPDGVVIDPIGGLEDLAERHVRFVGDADARIREDYLRILRFFRFHAWFGDPERGMNQDAVAACAKNAHGLQRLSRERVGHEMRRLLAAPDPAPALATMQITGVLQQILPGADGKALGLLVHLEGGRPPGWLRRLAALGGGRLGEALRLSGAEAKYLGCLCDGIQSTERPAVLAYRFGADAAQDVVLLRAALIGGPLPENWESAIASGAKARFPVMAADLMPEHTGAALGARLARLEARWIASGFELSREQLLS